MEKSYGDISIEFFCMEKTRLLYSRIVFFYDRFILSNDASRFGNDAKNDNYFGSNPLKRRNYNDNKSYIKILVVQFLPYSETFAIGIITCLWSTATNEVIVFVSLPRWNVNNLRDYQVGIIYYIIIGIYIKVILFRIASTGDITWGRSSGCERVSCESDRRGPTWTTSTCTPGQHGRRQRTVTSLRRLLSSWE
jgi:hypothetical protein